MNKVKVTVFTPTYNRAYTLERLYKSLLNQTSYEFVWLIVDDGSTDNTSELIKSFQNNQLFDVRYYKQKNSGKHVAINNGVELAEGELFFIVKIVFHFFLRVTGCDGFARFSKYLYIYLYFYIRILFFLYERFKKPFNYAQLCIILIWN